MFFVLWRIRVTDEHPYFIPTLSQAQNKYPLARMQGAKDVTRDRCRALFLRGDYLIRLGGDYLVFNGGIHRLGIVLL